MPDRSAIPHPSRCKTTQDKIARVEAIKAAAMEAATMKAKSANKKPKPRSIPPPGEAFQVAESRTKKRKGPPLTTKEKIVAESKKRSKIKLAETKKAEASTGHTKKDQKKAGATKTSSLFQQLDAHTAASKAKSSQVSRIRPSVLVRATQRTLRSPHQGREDYKFSRVTDLPPEIRKKIWQLSVVYPLYFIWPDSPTGGEQPDLAMVSRQIRAEVLPVYYAENRFAIDVSERNGNEAPATMVKWAAMMEEAGWLDIVAKWAFNFSNVLDTVRQEFVVSLDVSDQIRTSKVILEVHRNALCMLPASDSFEKCNVQSSPRWLNQAVAELLDARTMGYSRAADIIGLAYAMNMRAAELLSATCDDVMRSIEEADVRSSPQEPV